MGDLLFHLCQLGLGPPDVGARVPSLLGQHPGGFLLERRVVSNCRTLDELGERIERLKADLDAVLDDARKEVAAFEQRQIGQPRDLF